MNVADPMHSLIQSQFKALGPRDMPREIQLDGRIYRLEHRFKHSFMAAVGKYAREGEQLACKWHRKASFFGIPLCWLGKLGAAYEAAVLRQVDDLDGVPRFRGRPDPWSVAHEFVPGEPLHRDSRVSDDFFPRFLELLRKIHGRGIAYVDLEKARNILCGDDGRPYLIDFQTAFYVPRRLLGETTLCRFLRERLQRADLYHAMKHYRRVRPDRLTAEEIARTRQKPFSVRLGNTLVAPYKKLRRWLLAR